MAVEDSNECYQCHLFVLFCIKYNVCSTGEKLPNRISKPKVVAPESSDDASHSESGTRDYAPVGRSFLNLSRNTLPSDVLNWNKIDVKSWLVKNDLACITDR